MLPRLSTGNQYKDTEHMAQKEKKREGKYKRNAEDDLTSLFVCLITTSKRES